jgi:hypothetical protein
MKVIPTVNLDKISYSIMLIFYLSQGQLFFSLCDSFTHRNVSDHKPFSPINFRPFGKAGNLFSEPFKTIEKSFTVTM